MNKEQALSLRRLRFPADLERVFQEDYFRNSLGHARFLFVLGFFLVAAMGVQELAQDPRPIWNLLWRYGFVCPCLLGLFLFSFSPRFQRYMQASIAFAILSMLTGWMVILISAPPPTFDANTEIHFARFVLNTLVFLMTAYTLCRLHFLYATFVCWMLLAGAQVVALQGFHVPPLTLVGYNYYLLVVNLLGMLAAYSMEHYVRRDFLTNRLLAAEQEKSESLLLNILPRAIADRLKRQPGTIADSFAEVTILFADIVDFTPLAARLQAEQIVELLNEIFSAFDHLAEKHRLEKIKTIGDAYMVAGGLPHPHENPTEAIAEMALDMQREMARLRAEKEMPLHIRIGIHCGPVVAGVIGTRKFIYDLWGDAVNVASRMESHGVPDTIQTTEGVYRQLQAKYTFARRGKVALKGHGETITYLLLDRKTALCAETPNATPPYPPLGKGRVGRG